jgi:hypothetical protein
LHSSRVLWPFSPPITTRVAAVKPRPRIAPHQFFVTLCGFFCYIRFTDVAVVSSISTIVFSAICFCLLFLWAANWGWERIRICLCFFLGRWLSFFFIYAFFFLFFFNFFIIQSNLFSIKIGTKSTFYSVKKKVNILLNFNGGD